MQNKEIFYISKKNKENSVEKAQEIEQALCKIFIQKANMYIKHSTSSSNANVN